MTQDKLFVSSPESIDEAFTGWIIVAQEWNHGGLHTMENNIAPNCEICSDPLMKDSV